jgi:hypothetical protein
MSDIAATTTVASATSPPSPPAPSHGTSLWSHGSFGFKDLLDIINPLQHLPVVGSIYRYLTGDEPSGGARIVGDAIYGGPIGFGVGVVSAMLTDGDGRDLGERALASVFGPRGDSASATAVAQAPVNAPAAQPQAQAQAQAVQPAVAATLAGQSQPGSPMQLATQLYRSPPAAGPTTPEQNFLGQNAQFQRQLAGPRPEPGQVLNSRPVPLQLTGNPMASARPIPIPSARAATPASAAPANAASPVDAPVTNPVAQKMLDALAKYERLKKQQEQDDSAKDNVPTGVDLTL